MRLNEFIVENMEPLLQLWEQNAQSIFPGWDFTSGELRNHIRQVIEGVAQVMRHRRPATAEGVIFTDFESSMREQSWAHVHGAQRYDLGVDLLQVTAEFRALRTTVIELWEKTYPSTAPGLEELTHFHRAIDDALTESIERYVYDKESRARLYQAILTALPDPCYVLDLKGRFRYANQAMGQLCGVASHDLVGESAAEVGLPTGSLAPELLNQIVHHREHQHGEINTTLPSGQAKTLEYVYAPVLDQQGDVEAISGIAHDVTERRAAEAKAWHYANYDPLTGLPNRRLFRDRLEQHVAHAERTGESLTVFFIDLDRFKEVNDQYGHDVGDLLLKQVAERIEACVRKSDTVARLSGDEFTVILLDIAERETLLELAHTILTELAQPFALGAGLTRISGSIGITQFPQDAITPKQLLTCADKAMYFAKHTGRNQVCFYTDIGNTAALPRQALIQGLRSAREHGELRVYYQPIVHLASGRIAKAEALLRWAHPELGLLRPGQFLELAEESGIISDLEDWLITEVASQSEHWRNTVDRSVPVTINISSETFLSPHSQKRWQAYLDRLAGAGAIVELTERVFLNEAQGLAEQFRQIREGGLQLALDDYGTGVSSLAALRRYGIHYLKIDPSYVTQPMDENDERIIAETIVVMAHKLGLEVIAEGVETAEQYEWLIATGCDYAQGHFLDEPLSSEALLERLMAG
ncbi:GGDEF domain-containing protein [Marinobacter nanhaiticus D15-8W]|uniref:GGDEF domain-containing protein n=1 Tax=Marinobacter nanhaiticus D15-8W TaxID=626887 RepID=N6W3I4_9GAMM|nr:GGDEF and EAL domain-containing protein [Marinobacter nanhaiticus]ENO17105.2 GGDEF domain-containing protein [Marinobacter nanhaiticus D15-8W]